MLSAALSRQFTSHVNWHGQLRASLKAPDAILPRKQGEANWEVKHELGVGSGSEKRKAPAQESARQPSASSSSSSSSSSKSEKVRG